MTKKVSLQLAIPDFCRLNLLDGEAVEGEPDKIGLSDSMGPAARPAGCCCVLSKGDLGGC